MFNLTTHEDDDLYRYVMIAFLSKKLSQKMVMYPEAIWSGRQKPLLKRNHRKNKD